MGLVRRSDSNSIAEDLLDFLRGALLDRPLNDSVNMCRRLTTAAPAAAFAPPDLASANDELLLNQNRDFCIRLLMCTVTDQFFISGKNAKAIAQKEHGISEKVFNPLIRTMAKHRQIRVVPAGEARDDDLSAYGLSEEETHQLHQRLDAFAGGKRKFDGRTNLILPGPDGVACVAHLEFILSRIDDDRSFAEVCVKLEHEPDADLVFEHYGGLLDAIAGWPDAEKAYRQMVYLDMKRHSPNLT